jgi:AmiR/NasT family two-component response regulator
MNLNNIIEPDLSVAVRITDRDSLENQLDAAVAAVRERATGEKRRGVLVTRHSATEFTVALSDHVPFGLTQENHAW